LLNLNNQILSVYVYIKEKLAKKGKAIIQK